MESRAVSPIVVVILALAAAVLVANVITTGFERLGVPSSLVPAVLFASLVGSFVNVPVWLRTTTTAPEEIMRFGPMVFYRKPQVQTQVVAVNLGGAVVPTLMSLWLLSQAPLWKFALAVALVAMVTNRIARVMPGLGIAMPFFIPPVLSAVVAWLLGHNGAPGEAAALAYVSGCMGTLIGADIMNLPRLNQLGSGLMSIGGAGVFDGVFLAGIVAVFLT